MFILASSSPRRKELLTKIVKDFRILVPEIDESLLNIDAKDLPSQESKAKAYAIASLYPDAEILACDTIVVLHGKALGKPLDYDDAFRMLKAQSGQKEIVLSGYTYIGQGREITRTVATEVYFNDLSDELIRDYLQTKKPFDKAGAYGIQDGFPLIREIVGSFDNVMGLPTEDIYEHVILRGRSRR